MKKNKIDLSAVYDIAPEARNNSELAFLISAFIYVGVAVKVSQFLADEIDRGFARYNNNEVCQEK